jgi:FkbH-like protein
MILRQSRFLHQLPVGAGQILVVHALNYLRLNVTQEVSDIIAFFAEPRSVPEVYEELEKRLPYDRDTLSRCIQSLLRRGILTEKNPEEEMDAFQKELGATYGRDPLALLDRYRRQLKEGSEPCWSVMAPRGLPEMGTTSTRVDVILFGDCDLQMESDFLRREAATRGINLVVSATFPDDLRFASEHRHDAILIGALRARHQIAGDIPAGSHPQKPYLDQVRRMLRELRERTPAPILIDNLPEPTVQPLGLAERGLRGHRTRFRLTNVALAEVVEKFAGVHLVDVAAALGAIGSENLLDDGTMDFTHFGSAGWLLQRPKGEMSAVHHAFPPLAPLVQRVHGDPYIRENAMGRIHIDALVTALGIGRKKCVIVDLDGTLWPGVLAETGTPFAWDPATRGPFSFAGIYFGIHEALRCLKRRGLVLACVSKNDEQTVRELWKYGEHYPCERLLSLDDFVTWRINWNDKAENIRSIASELGFALDTFLFIDDHPVERGRVRQLLPEVDVWGENLLDLRRLLLNDPRLQLPHITDESARRTDLVKAQLSRQRLQVEMKEEEYIRSIKVQCRIERLTHGDPLDRVEELFHRTTQFNTTGRKFTVAELTALLSNPSADLFSMHVSDRFGDYGLVGAAVCDQREILGLVVSCRVLGLGVEQEFLKYILRSLTAKSIVVTARIVETSRNIRVRNIYRDNGFREDQPGLWCLVTSSEADRVAPETMAPCPAPIG